MQYNTIQLSRRKRNDLDTIQKRKRVCQEDTVSWSGLKSDCTFINDTSFNDNMIQGRVWPKKGEKYISGN